MSELGALIPLRTFSPQHHIFGTGNTFLLFAVVSCIICCLLCLSVWISSSIDFPIGVHV